VATPVARSPAAEGRRATRQPAPVVAVAALTIGGLLLRLICARQSIFGDELFTYEVATRPGLGGVIDGVRSPLEITPPLYFVLAWASAKVADPTFMLRLPSLLAGVALIPLVYSLGTRTVGRRAALAGASLAAIGPLAVFYSAEARAYMVMAFLVAASTWALLEALRDGRRAWWVAFVAAAAGALYAHYTAVFPLAAQGAWALWYHRDRLRPPLIAYAAVLVAYLPWVPELQADRGSGFQSAIGNVWPFTAEFFGKSLVTWLWGNPILGLTRVPGKEGLILLAAALAVAAAGAAIALRAREIGPPSPGTVLVLLVAAAAPLGAAAYSLVLPSIFVPRTLLGSLPALCLALGALVAWLRRPFGAVVLGLLLAACAVGTVHILTDERRPGYRDAAAEINVDAKPGDRVLETVLFDVGMLEVNLKQPFRLYRVGCERPITAPGQQLMGRLSCGGLYRSRRSARDVVRAARGRQLFVVSSQIGPQATIPGLERGFRLVDTHSFGGLDKLELRRYVSTSESP
jgi:Dolichyl-phosphate-mannose-protein mannosyltransferase